jgi:hypothetical protein
MCFNKEVHMKAPQDQVKAPVIQHGEIDYQEVEFILEKVESRRYRMEIHVNNNLNKALLLCRRKNLYS